MIVYVHSEQANLSSAYDEKGVGAWPDSRLFLQKCNKTIVTGFRFKY